MTEVKYDVALPTKGSATVALKLPGSDDISNEDKARVWEFIGDKRLDIEKIHKANKRLWVLVETDKENKVLDIQLDVRKSLTILRSPMFNAVHNKYQVDREVPVLVYGTHGSATPNLVQLPWSSLETPPTDCATLQVKYVCGHCHKGDRGGQKLLRCGGCRKAWYCSVECQKAARKEHKDQCR